MKKDYKIISFTISNELLEDVNTLSSKDNHNRSKTLQILIDQGISLRESIDKHKANEYIK